MTREEPLSVSVGGGACGEGTPCSSQDLTQGSGYGSVYKHRQELPFCA